VGNRLDSSRPKEDSTSERRRRLAAAVVRAIVGGSVVLGDSRLALAQDEPNDAGSRQPVEEVIVIGQGRDTFEDSALNRFTEPLRDTPQSITSVSADVLDDRTITSLSDALRTIPSITLGAGEFSWQGNNPNIRGFNARDDMYLDGIRDFGSYARDPFNLEALEVMLGPSSTLFGRGSTGGAINQVTKQPILDTLTNLSVNVGSDQTVRTTMDVARALSRDGAAFRLNALAHAGEVAGRDGAETERYGIAPSLAFGLGSATELTLSYMKQTADDRPDYGLPWLDGRPAPVSRESFYGFDSDYLKTDADIFTGHLVRDHSSNVTSDWRVRYASYSRESRITEPLISDPNAASLPLEDISIFRYVFFGDSEEALLTAQGTLTADLQAGGIEHSLVTGFELSSERSEPEFSFGIGVPETDLLQPVSSNPFSATSIETRVTADTRGDTMALYVLDTIKLSDAWQVVAGMRWDQFETDYDAERFAGTPTPFNPGDAAGIESFNQTDDVVSYRAALVYKPSVERTWYLAGSTSFNPSAQGLSLLSTGRGLGTNNALLEPEENRSLEAGFKADLRGGDLAFSSSVFDITKTNARVPDPNRPGFNALGGEQRVRGLSVDVTGLLSPRMFVQAGYTYLDSEVVKAAPGAATGAALANAPEHSLSVWVDYQISEPLDFGVGVRYVDETLAQNTGPGKSVPDYWLLDAMVRYNVSDRVTLKLNLTNLTDEFYFGQLHPWHVVPGPGFTATLAANIFLGP